MLSSGVIHAQLVNPGFETGDATGWTVSITGPATGVGEDGDSIPYADNPPAYVNVMGVLIISLIISIESRYRCLVFDKATPPGHILHKGFAQTL